LKPATSGRIIDPTSTDGLPSGSCTAASPPSVPPTVRPLVQLGIELARYEEPSRSNIDQIAAASSTEDRHHTGSLGAYLHDHHGSQMPPKQPLPPPGQPPLRSARPAGDHRRVRRQKGGPDPRSQSSDLWASEGGSFGSSQGGIADFIRRSHMSGAQATDRVQSIFDKAMLPTLNDEEDDERRAFRAVASLAPRNATNDNGDEGRSTWMAGSAARPLLALRRLGGSLPPPNLREQLQAPRVRGLPGSVRPLRRRMRHLRKRMPTWEGNPELELNEATSSGQQAISSSSEDEGDEQGAASSSHLPMPGDPEAAASAPQAEFFDVP